MLQAYRLTLKVIGFIIIALVVLSLFSGGLVIVGMLMVLPFVILGLLFFWSIAWITPVLKETWSGVKSPALPGKPRHTKLQKCIHIVMFVVSIIGLLLLANFVLIGGPNNGAGKQLLNREYGSYLDMQVGLGSLALASILMIVSVLIQIGRAHV